MRARAGETHRSGTSWVAGLAAIVALGSVAPALHGQTEAYPERPRPLPEAEEIALAMSAAPAEISAQAAVYVLRATGPARAREGTNGCTCMVSRDLHKGSLYPICFDQEATRTAFPRELMELRLRFEGKNEGDVKTAVTAAYADGTLRHPTRAAVVYMMSSRQVLFSSPLPEGRRVGAWHPHLMIAMPNATEKQLGFGEDASVGDFQLDHAGEAEAQLIVPVTSWADSARAAESR
jgi:hypothetical protein